MFFANFVFHASVAPSRLVIPLFLIEKDLWFGSRLGVRCLHRAELGFDHRCGLALGCRAHNDDCYLFFSKHGAGGIREARVRVAVGRSSLGGVLEFIRRGPRIH